MENQTINPVNFKEYKDIIDKSNMVYITKNLYPRQEINYDEVIQICTELIEILVSRDHEANRIYESIETGDCVKTELKNIVPFQLWKLHELSKLHIALGAAYLEKNDKVKAKSELEKYHEVRNRIMKNYNL